MVLSETLKLAIDSFKASKMRFALTALGMVIGTASVILVITIGLTGQEFVLQELEKIETNAIELEYSGGGATAAERVLYSDSLTRDDENAVLAQLPGVQYSSPVVGDARPHQLRRRRDQGHAGARRQPRLPADSQPARSQWPLSRPGGRRGAH
jgi:hypothetical protein